MSARARPKRWRRGGGLPVRHSMWRRAQLHVQQQRQQQQKLLVTLLYFAACMPRTDSQLLLENWGSSQAAPLSLPYNGKVSTNANTATARCTPFACQWQACC